jgi:hypothetical protein
MRSVILTPTGLTGGCGAPLLWPGIGGFDVHNSSIVEMMGNVNSALFQATAPASVRAHGV